MKQQQGLSLIELMVAIVISSLLILGVTEIFSRTFFADRDNTELTYMQESGRLALEIIGQDARRAGFQGCVASDTVTAFAPDNTTLPRDAVSSTDANSLTFRYATPGSGCGTIALNFEPPITYTNTNGGISRNGDPILDNATLAFNFIPNNDPIAASAIHVQITVSDSRTAGTPLSARTFSATYEMRNRLQ
ncbi:PilW family protein [Ectopseudomonas mendocina]|uniref:Prepilin-type N-terminal cleavage/methylation domain-containing protein n=1 Tax=Ectopseudomonas mendocina TaxID=300 RepID=A0A2R3QRA6_ECTME|nr:prepilin-type N-terminal cleavage/methylation domain-containing protein [Pseudomonas mendocina]AVO54329.1 hypothetical protein C7A17_16650 [Pseudomonas mendocina]